MGRKWVAVDLDGTLAVYTGTYPSLRIGDPIISMIKKVQLVLLQGKYDVKIFTSRIDPRYMKQFSLTSGEDITPETVTKAIQDWCLEHIGSVLEVTDRKDLDCVEIWDNIAREVINNEGEFLIEELQQNGNHTNRRL